MLTERRPGGSGDRPECRIFFSGGIILLQYPGGYTSSPSGAARQIPL